MLRTALLSIALLSAAGATRAGAQPTVAQATEAQKEAARAAYAKGKAAFGAKKFERALEHFRQADRSVASPNAKLMVGRCLQALERRAEAFLTFTQVVRDAQAWGNERYGDAAAAAEEELAALRPQLATLQLSLQHVDEDAVLTVGGLEIAREYWHEPLAAEPGRVEVVLRAPDGRRARGSVVLEKGVAATLALSLDEPEPDSTSQPDAATIATTTPAPESSGTRTAAYLLGGVGIAGLAGFAVLGALSAGKYDDLDEACPARRNCAPELRDEAATGETLQTIANVSLAVGGAALAAGVVLFVIGLDDEESATAVALHPGAVEIRGRF